MLAKCACDCVPVLCKRHSVRHFLQICHCFPTKSLHISGPQEHPNARMQRTVWKRSILDRSTCSARLESQFVLVPVDGMAAEHNFIKKN